jgi:hypothetical protein
MFCHEAITDCILGLHMKFSRSRCALSEYPPPSPRHEYMLALKKIYVCRQTSVDLFIVGLNQSAAGPKARR